MEHDQRFKALVRVFFAEFLELFFADWATRFDLSHVEWLDKELLPQPPDGPLHVLDMVARVVARQPVEGFHADAPWLVLVHVEIESPDQTTRLKPRLPQYYYHLRSAYGLPVLPLVIYLNVRLDGIGVDTCREQFWDLEVVTFRYLYVGLPGLDGVKYVQGDNWLGVALAALMNIPRDRVAWLGAEAFRRLSGSSLNSHKKFLLAECVRAYLPFDEQQQQEYERLLENEIYSEVKVMNKTYFEEGLEKGIEKGIEKGRLQGRRELILAIVEERFPPVSERMRLHIESLGMEELRQLTLRIAKAATLEDAGLGSFTR